MYLKDDILTVDIAGVTFRSYQLGAPEFILDPTALVGWTDGVDMKRTVVQRPIEWGDFSEPGLPSSRNISMSGTAVASSPQELHNLRDIFTGILADGHYSQIMVTDITGPRYATVSLSSKPQWTQLIDTAATWKLDFYAPDPRLYGVVNQHFMGDGTSVQGGIQFRLDYPVDFSTPTSLAALYVQNDGNVECWPTFVVTGDYSNGFSITDNLGHTISYTGLVTMRSPVTIDTARGTATQNGQDRTALVTSRGWFSLKPGKSIRPFFKPVGQTGSGWCDIIYRNTWI